MEQTNDLESQLAQFTSTENYYRHSAGRMYYTDGVQYLAETAQAYWLIDLIASYQDDKRITQDKMLRDMQIWHLDVDLTNRQATIVCKGDSDLMPTITQEIEYTDFPLNGIDLWVENTGDQIVLLLPREH